MRVTYVLAHPTLGGGTKVVAQHAALLRQAGVDVTIVAESPRPAWLPYDGPYLDTREAARLATQDLVIATYWTTLETAARLAIGPVAHFCQGYEGGLDYLRAEWPRIDDAYTPPVPTLTATPHLGEFLAERFGRSYRVTVPPLDPLFHPRHRWPLVPSQWQRPRRRPWIAIPGVFEASVKDVPTALRAVRRMRDQDDAGRGQVSADPDVEHGTSRGANADREGRRSAAGGAGARFRVLRFSPLPLSAGERELLVPDRYLHAVPPREMAMALRSCDLLLFPSQPEEGFGLPLLEAMASGVPAVASRIPSASFMTDDGAAVPLVPPGDDARFAESALALLRNPAAWQEARARGLEAARRFEPARVLPELLSAVKWAANADHARSTT
jgi:glycosyltransferase involved in cell wall biosynthesis